MTERLKTEDILKLAHHLHNIVKSGMPLDSSLRLMAREMKGKSGEIAGQLAEYVGRGSSLSSAFESSGITGNPYLIAMLQAGEQNGNLPEVLLDIIKHYQKNLRAERQIVMSCRYPFFILAIALCITLFIILEVVPKIHDIFIQIGVDLPVPIQFLSRVGVFLQNHYYVLIAIIFFLIVLATNFWTLSIFKRLRSRLELLLPFIGRLVYYDSISTFCSSVGKMIKQKIPLPEALVLTKMTLRNTVFQEQVEDIAHEVAKGKKFSEAAASTAFLPNSVSWSIKNAETRGDLDELLNDIATFYDDEFQSVSNTVAIYTEPFLIVVIGILIAVLAVTLYGPLFEIPKAIGGGGT